MLKILHSRRLDHPEFGAWKARALSAVDKKTGIDALVNIVTHHVFCGDVSKAGEAICSLQELLKTSVAGSLQRVVGKLQEILFSVLSGNSERGLDAAKEALEIADAGGVHVLDFPLIGNGLIAAFNSGNTSALRSLLARMPSHPEELRTWDKGFYHFLRAMERMDESDYPKALEYAERSMRYADQVQFPASCIWSRFMKALALHELGNHAFADRILEQALRMSAHVGSDLTRYEYLLIKSCFALDRGKEAACRKHLKEALKLGKEKGLISTFMPIRRDSIARLCMKALEAGIETGYAQTLIRKRKLVPGEPPFHIQNWPWQVKYPRSGASPLSLMKNQSGFPAKSRGSRWRCSRY